MGHRITRAASHLSVDEVKERMKTERRPWVRQHWRSEEHTSELQSPCNLVCRLLLEKKNEHAVDTLYNILRQDDGDTVTNVLLLPMLDLVTRIMSDISRDLLNSEVADIVIFIQLIS